MTADPLHERIADRILAYLNDPPAGDDPVLGDVRQMGVALEMSATPGSVPGPRQSPGALNQIPGFRCVEPGGAFYAFPNIEGTGMSAKELQNKMLDEAGVATVAGTSFGAMGEGFIRFSYAASVEEIEDACARVQRMLS